MTLSSNYSSKYPEIVTDKTINYPNAEGIIIKITAEQYQDLMHHTHNIEDLVSKNSSEISTEVSLVEFNAMKELINILSEKVTALEQAVENGGSTSEELNTINERLSAIENNVGIFSTTPEKTLNERVAALESGSGLIIDYDLDTPGTQDINGETIG